MDLILDTHVLVWFLLDSPQLGEERAALVNDSANRVFISAVTGYELANKHRAGKMPEAGPILALIGAEFARFDWHHLPVHLHHAQRAGSLQSEHRDPFDRLLAAQSMIEEMAVMTVDSAIKGLGARVVW